MKRLHPDGVVRDGDHAVPCRSEPGDDLAGLVAVTPDGGGRAHLDGASHARVAECGQSGTERPGQVEGKDVIQRHRRLDAGHGPSIAVFVCRLLTDAEGHHVEVSVQLAGEDGHQLRQVIGLTVGAVSG